MGVSHFGMSLLSVFVSSRMLFSIFPSRLNPLVSSPTLSCPPLEVITIVDAEGYVGDLLPRRPSVDVPSYAGLMLTVPT